MLTIEEQAANSQTQEHIRQVGILLHKVIKELLDRIDKHDQSKLASPEVELYTKYNDKLKNCTYNSEEYNKYKAEMKVALDHHYANNSHHPEFYKDGVNDMSLIDIIEMICDWQASSKRQHNGNLRKSIEVGANRFGLSPQLVKILENTIPYLE